MSAARRCIFQGLSRTLYWRHQGGTNAKEPAPRAAAAAAAAAAQLCGHGAAALRCNSSAPGGVREQTLIAVKPDGVQRRLVGQIIQRFEQRGFKLVGLKMLQVPDDLLAQHYSHLRTKPFYPSLQDYMTSGPVVAMVWEGHNVVQSSRNMVGHTDPAEARPGTVRGDFSVHVSRNVVHASDSLEGAEREIKLWFQGTELVTWSSCDQSFTHES